MTEMGHEDAFPRPKLSARCRFSQRTFAGTRDNGRDAPIPAPHLIGLEPQESTPLRTLGAGYEIEAPAVRPNFVDHSSKPMLRQTWNFSDPSRAAYFAGLHAAQTLIFETTGRVRKRHSTVQGGFAGLVRDDYEAALTDRGPATRRTPPCGWRARCPRATYGADSRAVRA